MRKVTLYLCPSVVTISLVCVFAPCVLAGPDYEAAMAEVDRGAAICPTGDLDSAMEVFRGVERQFPDETEAIGWARWWHSNCLLAGWRRAEVRSLMKPVWEQVMAGEITDATAKFLFGHQYARVLSPSNVLRSVAEKSLRFYKALKNPGPQLEEKAGFLNVFLSRCYYRTMEYDKAAVAGQAAWEAGEALRQTLNPATAKDLDVKPLVLAAWGRLEQAKAVMKQENLLLAQSMLGECAEKYSPAMEAQYVSEVDTVHEACRLELGLSVQVLDSLLENLRPDNEEVDRGLWLQATYHFANDTIDSGSRGYAIVPLSVAKVCYPYFPAWGLHIGLLWDRKARDHLSNEEFLAELDAVKDYDGPLVQASVRIEMAEILSDMGRGAEGSALLDVAESVVNEPRMEMALAVARAHCEQPGDEGAEVQAYEAILAGATGDEGLAEYIIDKVSRYYSDRTRSDTFGPWLDARKGILGDRLYRIQKAQWMRDHEEDFDGAVKLLEPLLRDPMLKEKWQPRIARIACLYRANRDGEAESALAEYEKAVQNLEVREHGLIEGVCLLTTRPEVACALADKVLETASTQLWRQDAMLMKGRMLTRMGRYAEAEAVLEELAADTPSEVVGEGLIVLARLYYRRLNHPDTARMYYEEVISASDTYRPIQAEAHRQYAEMEEALGNHDAALRIVEEGLHRTLPAEGGRILWLRLMRAKMLLPTKDRDRGRAELQDLASNSRSTHIRRLAAHSLMEEE